MAKLRKKSGFLGKLIAALLGFIVGIVSTLGGIVGVGYYIISTMTIKDGLNTLDVDYEGLLTEEFASNTLLGAVEDISGFASDASAGTASLSSLEKFSPAVREALSGVVSEFARYGVPVDLDEMMGTAFSGLGDYFMQAIDNTEIGKAAGAYTGGGANALIQLICYGEENHEFVMLDLDHNGELEVVMLGNNTPTLLSDLTHGDNFMDLFYRLSLGGLLNSTGGAENDDTLMRALLYGEENVDYEVVNDEVQMLPRLYVLDMTSGNFVEEETGDEFVYLPSTGIWVHEESSYAISAIDGTYNYVVVDGNGETVEFLKVSEPNEYEVYRFPNDSNVSPVPVKQFRRGLTIGDLVEGGVDIEKILHDVALADLLDLNGDSDSIMLTIAYGQEGVDYTVDPTTKEITPITTPTKVGDLLDLDTFKQKLNDLYLADLLDVSPLDDPKPDSILLLLTHGEEGVHFTLSDENGDGTMDTVNWLTDENGNQYGKRTVGELTTDGEEIFQGISLATILNVDATADPLLINLAYGASSRYTIVDGTFVMNPIVCRVVDNVAYDDMNEPFDSCTVRGTVNGYNIYEISSWNAHYFISRSGDVYYAYETLEEAQACDPSTRLTYSKQKLSSLRGDEAHLFVDQIELGAALGVEPTDATTKKLLVALAYGYEGEHFEINGSQVTWNIDPSTGLHYRPRTLKDLSKAEDVINSVKIADFFEEIDQATNPLMYTISQKGWTVKDINSTNIESLKLGEVMVISETSGILHALREKEIGALSDAIKDLTIADVIGESAASSNRFLKHIATTPIGQIQNKMDTLTVAQVFEDKVYKKHVVDENTYYYLDADDNRLYYNETDGKYYKDATFTQESTRVLTGTWKYMLTGGSKAYDEYTFNDFDELMNNISGNIKEATMQELVDDKVMTFEGINLDQDKIMGIPISTLMPGKTTLGDLSLIDLLNVIKE